MRKATWEFAVRGSIVTAAAWSTLGLMPVQPVFGQPPVADVVIAQAEMRKVPDTMTVIGTVEPLTRSVVGSEIGGIVEAMPVRQGDLVERGALIVKLNDDSLTWQLAEADASVEAAQARLTQTKFELARVKRLAGMSQANEKEVYDTQAAHDIAQYEVQEKQAIANRLRSDLAKTEITAPFAGFIVSRRTEVGEWVDAGGAVVEVVDLSSVLVRVDVPESAMPYVAHEAPARVHLDALKRSFEGKVWHVIRQADPAARTFPVEITIENPDYALAAGMFARATVISGPSHEAVAVPKDAVVELDGVRYVGLVTSGEHGKVGMLTPVTTGADIGDWVAVTSGNVRAGMDVIIRGNERGVFPGFPSPVRIVTEAGVPVDTGASAADGAQGRGS